MLPSALALHNTGHPFSSCITSPYLLPSPYMNPAFQLSCLRSMQYQFLCDSGQDIFICPLQIYCLHFSLLPHTLGGERWTGSLVFDVTIYIRRFFCLPSSKSVHPYKSMEGNQRVKGKQVTYSLGFFPSSYHRGPDSSTEVYRYCQALSTQLYYPASSN